MQRAHGVVASHPHCMRKALGSNPSGSNLRARWRIAPACEDCEYRAGGTAQMCPNHAGHLFSRVRLRRPVRMGLPPAAPDCRGVVVGRPVVGAWFGRGLAGVNVVGCVRDLGGSIRGSVIPWLPLVGSLAWANARQGFGGRLREPRPSFASNAR